MRVFLFAVLLTGMQACAHGSGAPAQSPIASRESAVSKNVEIGNLLAQRGHCLEASFYYEAALAKSDDEKKILPKLIAAQIRSDRLREAEHNTVRLISLAGESPELSRLLALLKAFTPPILSSKKEMEP